MNWIRSHPALFLLALALLAFLPFVGGRDIVTSHEARVVQVARQMAEAGWPWDALPVQVPKVTLQQTSAGERLLPSADGSTMQVNPWIVPIMNGQVRLQKPPLPYWCTATLYRLFGFSETASRVIPALMGCVAVWLVWDLARLLSNRLTAWYSALVWVSTLFIVDEFRKVMADPYLGFFTLAAMWAWVRERSMLFWVTVALGILSKGPLIFVFVVPMMAAYAWVGQSRTFHSSGKPLSERAWIHFAGLLLLMLITLPWPVAAVRAVPNAPELWRYESVGALSDKDEDSQPWWYYLPNLLLVTLPWTPAWIIGFWTGLKHGGRRILPAACTIVVVIIFSLAHGKKNAYLLPLMPLICLTTAQGLTFLTRHRRLRPTRQGIIRLTGLAVFFVIIVQGFLSGFETWKDNRRSSWDAARFVSSLLSESSRRTVLLNYIPEDATPYLPLGLSESPQADEAYVILDDRKGLAETRADQITQTAAGRVIERTLLSIPDSKVTRWKVYRLTISPVQRPPPSAG